jgi:hypothetical protein
MKKVTAFRRLGPNRTILETYRTAHDFGTLWNVYKACVDAFARSPRWARACGSVLLNHTTYPEVMWAVKLAVVGAVNVIK